MNQRQVTKIDGHFLAIDHLNFAEAALLVLAVHQAETAGNLHAFPRHGDDFEFSTPDTRGAVILNKLGNTDSGHHRIHRSEEHTSELKSLMRTSYAVLCLKKK